VNQVIMGGGRKGGGEGMVWAQRMRRERTHQHCQSPIYASNKQPDFHPTNYRQQPRTLRVWQG
jgi:hypothetical protein